MAKRIKVGNPVNSAESWAFDLLEKQLPSDYLLVTNVELPTATGQLLEIDAIVFGRKAIYLVDVKGYSGSLSIDANAWFLDGRRIDNPLSKANQVSRIYASRIRAVQSSEDHSPWCQGAIFVTGNHGRSLSLVKSQETLSVFGPETIIVGLTDDYYVTSSYKHGLESRQREQALNVLGHIGQIPSGPTNVAGYIKLKSKGIEEGVEVWFASSNRGELQTEWLLKEVDLTAASTLSYPASEKLKAEYIYYQQLSGVPGVAFCAPIVSDGEFLLLPIRMPSGDCITEVKSGSLGRAASLFALRSFISALQQFSVRGLESILPGPNQIFIDREGVCSLLLPSIADSSSRMQTDVLKYFWGKVSSSIDSVLLSAYFDNLDEVIDYENLRFLLASEMSGKTSVPQDKFVPAPQRLLLGRYRLESLQEKIGSVETWKAFHETARFDIVSTIVGAATDRWNSAQQGLARLLQNFHPGVERVFDVEYVACDDIYVVNKAWVEGDLIEGLSDPNQVFEVFLKCLETLSYLHSIDVLHRRICPGHIMLQGNTPILVSLSVLPREELIDSVPDYVHQSVADEGWTPRADLWALVRTFLVTQPEALKSCTGEAFRSLLEFIDDPDSLELGSNYVATFGLQPKKLVAELPSGFAVNWSISKGYMTFLLLDMLNDTQPRSRNQIVLNALRSRRIPGNKINKSSMSTTISRLKSAGIAEDYGKKVRLTEDFLSAWRDVEASS